MAAGQKPGVIYEIYPRSFQDSNSDGIGDLNGVTRRLDDLTHLGVDCIWLMPVMQSPSAHGYDITNYKAVQSRYGDLNTLAELIQSAHQRGLRVLLDMPVNSTSDQHPWFQASAASSEASPSEHETYIWSNEPLVWTALPGNGIQYWHPFGLEYYFSSFSTHLPDLNWRSEAVFLRILDVFKYWVDFGVDGFRLDAAKHLIKGPNGELNQPETHQIWQRLTSAIHQVKPSTYFVGEVWDSIENIAPYYGAGNELDSAFDFPFLWALRADLKQNLSTATFRALQNDLQILKHVDFMAPIIGNHDIIRLASEVPRNTLKLAALAQLTLPGVPTIYYGDEIGLEDSSAPGDLNRRAPMQWASGRNWGFSDEKATAWAPFSPTATSVAAQRGDPQSLYETYRSLIALRKNSAALSRGSILDPRQPSPSTLSYWRQSSNSGEKMLVVLNFANVASGQLEIPVAVKRKARANPVLVFGSLPAPPVLNGGRILVGGLPPLGGVVIKIQ